MLSLEVVPFNQLRDTKDKSAFALKGAPGRPLNQGLASCFPESSCM